MAIPKKKQPDDPDYRSKFEQTIGEFFGELAEHEPEKIYFIQPEKKRFYLPDFKLKNGIYVEAKGKFVASDRTKHIWLKEQHPDKRIVIIFQNANVKLSKKSKTSYGDWCSKNNIEWYNWKDGIPAEIIKTTNENNLNRRNTRRGSRNTSGTKSTASPVSNRSRSKRSVSKGS